MKILFLLICKDLRRDWKHPWTILLFSSLPLLMTALIATVFGSHGGSPSLPIVHVAVLDQDKDMLSKFLRSLASQGDGTKNLQLHFVDTREEGVRWLEKRKASAFVVLPCKMTESLLDGKTNSVDLYENPAEQVLPKVVRQGLLLAAAGLSGAGELLHEPLKDFRDMVNSSSFPDETAVANSASQSFKKIKNVKTYLFPPLIQFQTVASTNWSVYE